MRSCGWKLTEWLFHWYADSLGSSMLKRYGVPQRGPAVAAKEILDATDFYEPERYLAAFNQNSAVSLEVRHEDNRRGIYKFSFPSPYKKILQPQNKTVYATLYRANLHAYRVIFLVGAMYASGNRWDNMIACCFARFGFDVCLLVLPYHGPRARGVPSGWDYVVPDPVATNEAFTQSELDLNLAYDILHTKFGYSKFYIMGVSAGASVAHVSTFARSYEGAVFIASGAPLSEIFWYGSSSVMRAIKNETAKKYTFREVDELWAISDVSRFLVEPKCRRYLMMNGSFDTVARPCYAKRLQDALPGCKMLVYPGGHYNVPLFMPRMFPNILRFFRGDALKQTKYTLEL